MRLICEPVFFFFFFFIFVKKKKTGEGPFRRSKVTPPFSLTCSVDFLQAQSPHLGCRFLALILSSFTSLNPFEKFFRPLQPQPICMRIPGSTSRFRLYIENAVAKQAVYRKSIRLGMSEENFHMELSRINLSFLKLIVIDMK